MFGKACEVCKAKDAHIADLKQQIDTLTKLLYPSRPTQDVATTDIEVDNLLNGQDYTTTDEVNREADRILSGEYEFPEEL